MEKLLEQRRVTKANLEAVEQETRNLERGGLVAKLAIAVEQAKGFSREKQEAETKYEIEKREMTEKMRRETMTVSKIRANHNEATGREENPSKSKVMPLRPRATRR